MQNEPGGEHPDVPQADSEAEQYGAGKTQKRQGIVDQQADASTKKEQSF